MKDFLIVSAHTKDKEYSEEASRLKESLIATGNTNFEITPFESKGSWEKNCQHKALVIRDSLVYNQKPILWIDADAIVKNNLDIFKYIESDIALCKYKLETLSGTVFFNYTGRSLEVLSKWISINESNNAYDQENLALAISQVAKINITALDLKYCKIDGKMPEIENEVIFHTQASRYCRNTIEKYRNYYKNKETTIFLSGPSLNKYHLSPNDDSIKIGVNSVIFKEDLAKQLDFYFIQDQGKENNKYSLVSNIDFYKNYLPKKRKFYCTNNLYLDALRKEHNASPFYSKTTAPIKRFGNLVIPDPEIPPQFSKEEPFETAGSIGFVVLQFALFCGFKKIRIVGADLGNERFNDKESPCSLDYLKSSWIAFSKWVKNEFPEVSVCPVDCSEFVSKLFSEEEKRIIVEFPQTNDRKEQIEKRRLHLLSLPYSITSKDKFNLCAFTSKLYNFIKMMKGNEKYELYHYGHPEAEVDCNIVETISPTVWEESYKDVDWKNNFFNIKQNTKAYEEFHERTPKAIESNLSKNTDGVLCFAGMGHKNTTDQLNNMPNIIEPVVGYTSIYARYVIVESKSHRNRLFNEFSNVAHDCIYNSYSFVIPSFVNKNDFEFSDKKEDYILFLGRLIKTKGIYVIAELAKQFPKENFVFAGPLMEKNFQFPLNCQHIGYADYEMRRNLLSKAKCVLMPTLYTEPFGNVMIESFLSGTPVISTNWGAFEENNIEGITGFLCDTYQELAKAIQNIESISPYACRLQGEKFSLENIGPKYDEVFDKIWEEDIIKL